MLICTLSIKDHDKAFFWTSRFNRDEGEKIVSFTDRLDCTPMEGSGRFMQVWKLETWMGMHVAVNYATVLKALGKEVDPKYVEIAKMVRETAPPGYPFVRLNVEDVVAAVRRMAVEEN